MVVFTLSKDDRVRNELIAFYFYLTKYFKKLRIRLYSIVILISFVKKRIILISHSILKEQN
jgi:hypothetical protein